MLFRKCIFRVSLPIKIKKLNIFANTHSSGTNYSLLLWKACLYLRGIEQQKEMWSIWYRETKNVFDYISFYFLNLSDTYFPANFPILLTLNFHWSKIIFIHFYCLNFWVAQTIIFIIWKTFFRWTLITVGRNFVAKKSKKVGNKHRFRRDLQKYFL